MAGAFELMHMSSRYFLTDRYPQFNCYTEQFVSGLTIKIILEYPSIRLDVNKALGNEIDFKFIISDSEEKYVVSIKNCVINFRVVYAFCGYSTTVTISHHCLGSLALL